MTPTPTTGSGERTTPSDDASVHQNEGEGWRIVVDRDLCQGHATCQGEAPGLFEVSKKGDLTILDERPPEDARAAAEAAVKYCPTHALSIDEGTS
ncbi:ferredoxin [Actinospongicola halichondriae]|uniref:ferredoxin n=1 Tax=Actinospongicola halichondriae TaxID=3236844 RepID=UPI003D52752F